MKTIHKLSDFKFEKWSAFPQSVNNIFLTKTKIYVKIKSISVSNDLQQFLKEKSGLENQKGTKTCINPALNFAIQNEVTA